MTPTLLALDLGTKTGWAMRSNGLILSGTQSFQPGRFEGGGMRFLKFTRWLDELHALGHEGITRLAFEEVRNHAGVTAAHVYGGFLSHLQVWGEQKPVPFEGVPVGTIKKHATGKGNASKADMIKWARSWAGPTVAIADDNQADALAILNWMISNEATSNHDRGHAPDRLAQGRVPVGALSLARRPITNRGR